jgi:hypothetical protein
MFGLDKCTLCANLTTPAAIDACIACAASPDDRFCSSCEKADRTFNGPTLPIVLASVDACYACQAKATGGNFKLGSPIPAKAVACGECYYVDRIPKTKRGECLACVASSTEATAAGCSGCFDVNMGADTSKCLGCLKRAKVEADSKACGSCSQTNMVPAALMDSCFDCVFKAGSADAKSYCSNLARETKKDSVMMMYKCLSTAQNSDRASACWQCYQNDPMAKDSATNGKCYECIGKMTSEFGIYCTHCWSTNRVQQKTASTCQSCIIGKEKSKGSGGDCI